MDNSAFCDFVSVTFSNDDWTSVRAGIEPCLDTIGASVDFDDSVSTLWRVGENGTVKAKRYGPVTSLGASGAACAALRLANVFGVYLSALGSVPHKVTRLDASRDVVTDTPAVLADIVDRSVSESGISLTRKRVRPEHITRLVARRSDGLDTGTCYVGSMTADVRACVYDKQAERLSRGLVDVGPLTRYELRLKSNAGVTLRDAFNPTDAFWHFMAPDILPAPESVLPWVSHGEGFPIDWPELPLPAERLRRRVQASPDLVALLRLAREVGPYGFEFMVAEMRKLAASGDGVRGLAPVETASIAH